MSEHSPKRNPCHAGCRRCQDDERSAEPQERLAGWRLSLAAACGFLLPLGLAIVGAAACSTSWQWAGCAGGLGAGLIVAWALGRWFRPQATEGGRA